MIMARIRSTLWVLGLLGLALGSASCGSVSPPQGLASRIASARTAADHDAIARLLLEEADEYATDARRHWDLAAKYEASAWWLLQRHHDRSEFRMAEHCRMVAEKLERAAADLEEMAREHERLAGELAGRNAD